MSAGVAGGQGFDRVRGFQDVQGPAGERHGRDWQRHREVERSGVEVRLYKASEQTCSKSETSGFATTVRFASRDIRSCAFAGAPTRPCLPRSSAARVTSRSNSHPARDPPVLSAAYRARARPRYTPRRHPIRQSSRPGRSRRRPARRPHPRPVCSRCARTS